MEGVRGDDQQKQLVKPFLGQVNRKADDRGMVLDVCLGPGAVYAPLLPPPLVDVLVPELNDHSDGPPPCPFRPVEGFLGGPGLLVVCHLETLTIEAGTVTCVTAQPHELVGSAQVTGEDGGVLELSKVELLEDLVKVVGVLLAPVGGADDQAAAPPPATVPTHVWAEVGFIKDGELYEVFIVAAILSYADLGVNDSLPDNVLVDDMM